MWLSVTMSVSSDILVEVGDRPVGRAFGPVSSGLILKGLLVLVAALGLALSSDEIVLGVDCGQDSERFGAKVGQLCELGIVGQLSEARRKRARPPALVGLARVELEEPGGRFSLRW